MKDDDFGPVLNLGGGASFGDTDWWVVRKAGQPELPQADAARASLCRTYWHPVYWYVRRIGHGHEDAQDLTQEFFARLLERNYVQAAAAEKGKFRTYLLTMLKRFMADQWDRSHRQKRGGGPQRSRLMRRAPSSSAAANWPMKPRPKRPLTGRGRKLSPAGAGTTGAGMRCRRQDRAISGVEGPCHLRKPKSPAPPPPGSWE